MAVSNSVLCPQATQEAAGERPTILLVYEDLSTDQ
jgi:hypothetical protein